MTRYLSVIGSLLLGLVAGAAEPGATTIEKPCVISAALKDAAGILTHTVQSPYQAGQTEFHVLLPDRLETGRRYPVVYVLPVEALNEHRWGDGLQEILKHDLHNRHAAIFVAPTFSHLPWYTDHPTRLDMRQETYFVKLLVPEIERRYPVQAARSGRLLLGFSKSGYGAFTLLLRQPQIFGRAVAWDSPVTKAQPDQFGMGEIYGTQENFEKYRLTRLWAERVADLRGPPRLSLIGYDNFREQHVQAHELLLKLKIPHHYEDGPKRPHHWNSGWVPPAVAWLLSSASPPQ